jgi:regulatory protein
MERDGSRAGKRRAGTTESRGGAEDPPLARARSMALRWLAARPRTEAQIRARLAREGLAEQADPVVVWLRGLGYLDDAAYALAQARSLLAPGKLGPLKVERRLLGAGIGSAEAAAAVRRALEGEEGRPPAEAERELCSTLAERRARRPLAEIDDRERAQVARFLTGRGFRGGVVAAVLGIYVDTADS